MSSVMALPPKGMTAVWRMMPSWKDGDVSGSTTDVDQGDAGFLFFFAQDRGARGDGLEDQLVDLQPARLMQR